MQVREVMNPSVVSITPEESVALAARLLARHNIGSLPVVDGDGCLRGILTDRDIVVRCIAAEEDPANLPAKEVMTRSCAVTNPGEDARSAAQRMARSQVRRLPVVEEGKVVGMVALGDLARCRACDMEAARALCDISDFTRRGWEG